MKFLMVKQIDTTLEKFRIVPPCQGYYTNLSIQNVITTAGNWPAGDLTELYDLFMMGVNIQDDLFLAKADASGEGQVGDMRVHPDLYPPNSIYQKFVEPGDDDQGLSYTAQSYNWGKKRLYVNNDTDVVEVFYHAVHAVPANYILVQGNFIPKRGAVYKEINNVGDIDAGEDFTTENYVFSQDLDNAKVKVTVSTLAAAAETYTAVIYFRKGRVGDVTFADTLDDGFGDILDGDMIDQSRYSAHGIIGALEYKMSGGQALGALNSTIIDLGTIREGDYLAWDVKLLQGTIAGTAEVELALAGIIPRQEWCEDASFFEHEDYYNINKDPNGVYVAVD